MASKWDYDEIEIRLSAAGGPQTGPPPRAEEGPPSPPAAPSAAGVRVRDLISVEGDAPTGDWPFSPDYPVVIRSPVGDEVNGRFHFPFSRDEVVELLARGPWLTDDVIEQRGKRLFEAMFADNLRIVFELSHRAAVERGRGLRLRLTFAPPELAALPWEILRHPAWNVALAQSERTPVLRHVDQLNPVGTLAVSGKLRVLLVAASPKDQRMLDLDQERDRIAEGLRPLHDQVEVTPLQRARPSDLADALSENCYHIVHFMLHGDYSRRAEKGLLALEDDAGATRELSAQDLGVLLSNSPSTRLVVFNACQSARESSSGGLRGLAGAVVRLGVPAVVAMQYPITDAAAIEFAAKLYLALAEGLGVEQAVAKARMGVRLRVGRDNEWLTPVLYLRPGESILFKGRPSDLPSWEPADRQTIDHLRHQVGPSAGRPLSDAVQMVLSFRALSAGGDRYVVTASTAQKQAAAEWECPAVFRPKSLQERCQAAWTLRQESDPRALGEELFRSLFTGDIGTLYRQTLSSAGAARQRLRLTISTTELEFVPWEILRDPQRGVYLAAVGTAQPICRRIASFAPPPAPLSLPLRVLLVTCSPKDLPPLALDREWDWLAPVQRDAGPGMIRIDRLKDPTLDQLNERLHEEQYHVLHFTGYDSLLNGGEGMGEGIVLVTKDETRYPVPGEDLAQMLAGIDSLQLVVTNTCCTASTLPASLVQAAVRSAIGMRYLILDEVAVRFTYLFYKCLLQCNLKIDAALAETRKWLLLETNRQFPGQWSYPSLCTSVEGDDYFLMAGEKDAGGPP